MERSIYSKTNSMVINASKGEPGSPNWAKILEIITAADSSPDILDLFIHSICHHLLHDTKPAKLNVLHLLDALFKNCKRSTLVKLQGCKVTQTLDRNEIAEDPQLKNFIVDNAKAWTTRCTELNCLSKDFLQWREEYCKIRFVPKVNDVIREHFRQNFETVLEVLMIFSECLIEHSEENKHLLQEIHQSVQEVKRRLDDLLPTFVGFELAQVLTSARRCTYICLDAYDKVMKGKKVNSKTIRDSIEELRSFIPQKQKIHQGPPRPKIKTTDSSDISIEEFFRRLTTLKQQNAKPVESLLDL